jgi:serine protease Do
MSQGSGFFISADGFAVTNNHVIEGATQVELVMDDGRTVQARVVGRDPRTDIALLKAEGNNFPFVRLSKANPRVGDWIIAVGNPFGLGGTVTAGIVSANGRDIGAGPYDDFIQIDAPVNRGNSGGPTFNAAGEVVGVNTAIVSPSGGNVGIAFAVPAASVERVVEDLRAKGSVTRGFIGVQIQPVSAEIADAIGLKEARGALVADAQAEGPAARAGLRRGDTILAIEGRPIRDARELSRRIAEVKPGERISVTVFREGRERTITIEVGRQPAA